MHRISRALLCVGFGAASARSLAMRTPAPLVTRFAAALTASRVRMLCDTASPTAEAPPAAADADDTFSMLDVRVGRIVDAWEHPDSDKLWCEKIDVGEEEPREIASGLRAYYTTADELKDRKVLVVCNLKPAKLGGFASNGMVLCASSDDRSTVAFVEPPEAAEVGERVSCEGADVVEAASPNKVKKKKLMEKSAEELCAVDSVATYRGKAILTSAGPCTSPTVPAGTIN